MPALIAPLVGFALGVALAWLCRVEAAREDASVGRARMRVAALFAALVFAPACAYFVAFAADWSLFYLVDGRAVPSALLLVLVFVDAGAVVGGFQAGYHAARAGTRTADRALLVLGAVPAAVACAVAMAFLGRLRVDGTFHQVSERFGTRPVAGGPLGYAILWMGGMIVAGMVIAAQALGARPPPGPSAPAPPVAPVAPPKQLPSSRLGRRR